MASRSLWNTAEHCKSLLQGRVMQVTYTKVRYTTITCSHTPSRIHCCLLQHLRIAMSTDPDASGLPNLLHRLEPLLCRSENDSRAIVIMTCGIAGKNLSCFHDSATTRHGYLFRRLYLHFRLNHASRDRIRESNTSSKHHRSASQLQQDIHR